MIQVDIENRFVSEKLAEIFESISAQKPNTERKPLSISARVCDYEGVSYELRYDSKSSTVVRLSVAMLCFQSLLEYGVIEHAQAIYGSMIALPAEGFDFAIELDVAKVPEDDESRKSVVKKFASLKRNLMSVAYERGFDDYVNKKTANIYQLSFGSDESIYIRPQKDSCAIVFTMKFDHVDDVAFARVFMQEFADARRDPALRGAPAVNFVYLDGKSKKPIELDKVSIRENGIGCITFAFFEKQVAAENRTKTINLIHQFRTYLHYHMKCANAYLHFRMRQKYNDFLQVLNRAKPTANEKKSGAGRTSSGRVAVKSRFPK